MVNHIITSQEAEILRDTLLERGELSFPLGTIISGFLCGAVYKTQKHSKQYSPKFQTRLIAKLSASFTSVLSFLIWIGLDNVDVWSAPSLKDGKMNVHVRLKPNKALKCAPLGPDAAKLRRLT